MYICPFSNSECNPFCYYWESSNDEHFIPIKISYSDLINLIPKNTKLNKILLALFSSIPFMNTENSDNLYNGYCRKLCLH